MKIKINKGGGFFKNLKRLKPIKNSTEVGKEETKKVDDLEETEKATENDTNTVEINNLETRVRRRKIERNSVFNKIKFLKNYNIQFNLNGVKFGLLKKYKPSYYFLLFGMFVLGAVSVAITIRSYNAYIKEDYSSFASSSIDDVKNSVDNTTKNEVVQNNTVSQGVVQALASADNSVNTSAIPSTKKSATKNTSSQPTSKEPTILPLKFIRPVKGETIKQYSMNEVIYSKTLELYKTHDGIDFKANIGDEVKSSEAGIVEKIYDDAFYGLTIIIDHGQGYKTMYSNLQELKVKVKQSVKKGVEIATVGHTSIGEYMDEPHLHFGMYFNSKTIDPVTKFYE